MVRHAPVAILATKIHGESPFTGCRLTCFANDEEEEIGLAGKAQWLLETELQAKVALEFSTPVSGSHTSSKTAICAPGETPTRSAKPLAERLLDEFA